MKHAVAEGQVLRTDLGIVVVPFSNELSRHSSMSDSGPSDRHQNNVAMTVTPLCILVGCSRVCAKFGKLERLECTNLGHNGNLAATRKSFSEHCRNCNLQHATVFLRWRVATNFCWVFWVSVLQLIYAWLCQKLPKCLHPIFKGVKGDGSGSIRAEVTANSDVCKGVIWWLSVSRDPEGKTFVDAQ